MSDRLTDSSDCVLVEPEVDDLLALDEEDVRALEDRHKRRTGPRTKMQEELDRRSREDRVKLAKELAEEHKNKGGP